MLKYAMVLAALTLSLSAQVPAPLMKNCDFGKAAGDQATVPADWRLPEGAAWARAAGEGPEGKPCLRFEGAGAVAEPAVGESEFLVPGTTYEFRATAKATGGWRPLFRLVDANDQKELATLTLQGAD